VCFVLHFLGCDYEIIFFIIQVLDKIEYKIISTLASEYKVVKATLSDLPGTIDDVAKRERKIVKKFKTIIDKNEEMQPILAKLQRLIDEIE
jgi:hypothetical protein